MSVLPRDSWYTIDNKILSLSEAIKTLEADINGLKQEIEDTKVDVNELQSRFTQY